MKSPILAITVLVSIATAIRAHAVDDTVEVTATGVGTTVEAAEKNAIINAVQQAVGLYVDGETLVKNDQVVHEKILSVSSGFIKTSTTTVPVKKRLSDGLFETTIRAVVQKQRVAEELRKAKVPMVVARVKGEDLWAEAITKIKNADDGKALFAKILVDAQDRMLRARLVDVNGRSGDAAARPDMSADAVKGVVVCAWNIELSIDQEQFYREVSPALEKVLDAISLRRGKDPLQFYCPTRLKGNSNTYQPKPLEASVALTKTPVRWWPRPKVDDPFSSVKRDDEIVVLLNTTLDSQKEQLNYRWYVLSKQVWDAEVRQLLYGTRRPHELVMEVGLIRKNESAILRRQLPIAGGKSLMHKPSVTEKVQYKIPLADSEMGDWLYEGVLGVSPGQWMRFRYKSGASFPTVYQIEPWFRTQSSNNFFDDGWVGAESLLDRKIIRFEEILDPEDLKALSEVRLSIERKSTK